MLNICIFNDETEEILLDRSIDSQMDEFFTWWVNTAVEDFARTVPKIEEYGGSDIEDGSADLRLIGENVAEVIGLKSAASALKQEIGAWFYLQGKIARCVSNYKHGLPAKEDTLLDAAIYVQIMRRLQEHGNWP